METSTSFYYLTLITWTSCSSASIQRRRHRRHHVTVSPSFHHHLLLGQVNRVLKLFTYALCRKEGGTQRVNGWVRKDAHQPWGLWSPLLVWRTIVDKSIASCTLAMLVSTIVGVYITQRSCWPRPRRAQQHDTPRSATQPNGTAGLADKPSGTKRPPDAGHMGR